MLDEVLNQIGRRQKFILTSHARPDGDAVGSTLACCQILRSMGKQANVVLSDGVPGIYRPLPYAIRCCWTSNRLPKPRPPSSWNAMAWRAPGSPDWNTITSSTSTTTLPRVPLPT